LRARFFLLKGKENFFAGFCSERAGRRGFVFLAGGQKFLVDIHSPTPFLFAHLLDCPLRGRGGFSKKKKGGNACPTLPVRGQEIGTS
jgi:hypothetical protein